MQKYKCLVLDHDDTVVMSTPEVHYPQFVESLKRLRPDISLTLEQFMLYCYEPGFHTLCMEILNYSEEEMEFQLSSWKQYVSNHSPRFYPDIKEIIEQQKSEGGLVCVVSHSCKENIERDYRNHCSILPDMIFGWELGENQRKPHPYPLEQIMKTYELSPKDLLMVDDLKPGFDMAQRCGVDFACAGWSHQIDAIANEMKKNCTNYLSNVRDLLHLLF